jgi:hypothetical protein
VCEEASALLYNQHIKLYPSLSMKFRIFIGELKNMFPKADHKIEEILQCCYRLQICWTHTTNHYKLHGLDTVHVLAAGVSTNARANRADMCVFSYLWIDSLQM